VIAEPIAGKYQKRSARTVGKTTGMLETGKYDRTIQTSAKAMTGAAEIPAAERRARDQEKTPTIGADRTGKTIAAAPMTLSGKISRSGIGSWGAE